MNDAEFKGYVKAKLESHDHTLDELKGDVKEIRKMVTSLRVSSAKGGVLGGAITSGLAFLLIWIKTKLS